MLLGCDHGPPHAFKPRRYDLIAPAAQAPRISGDVGCRRTRSCVRAILCRFVQALTAAALAWRTI